MNSLDKLELIYKNVEEYFKSRKLYIPQLERDYYLDLIEELKALEIIKKHITICNDRMCLRSPNTARIQLSIYNKSDYSDFKKIDKWLKEKE